jgi:hypothetical protein
MINLDSQFDQDQDYKTFGQRYQEGVKKIKSDAASMVNNRSMRESFELSADTEITRGFDRLAQKAWAKERDSGIASLQDVIGINRENALRSGDDATAIKSLNASRDAINAAVENGYLDNKQAQRLHQVTAVDYATARVGMMEPDQRQKVLSTDNPLSKMIPMDVRQKMLNADETYVARQKAIGIVDSMMGASPEGADALMRKSAGSDPVMLQAVRSEYAARHAINEQAKRQAQDDALSAAYSGIAKAVEENRIPTLNDIDHNAMAQLDGENKMRVLSSIGNIASKSDISNPDLFLSIVTNEDELRKVDPSTLAGQLNKKELDGIVSAKQALAKKGSVAQVSMGEMNNAIKSRMISIGKPPKDYAKMQSEAYLTLQQLSQAHFEQKGYFPEEKLVNQWADDLFKKEVVGRAWYGGAKEEVPMGISDIPDEEEQKLRMEFAREGIVPTSAAMLKVYNLRKGK